MNPQDLIDKYFEGNPKAKHIYETHVRLVAKKALEIAKNVPELGPDIKLIEEAALLHDIAIVKTNAPMLGCHGDKPYLSHADIAKELLEKEGLPKHALIAQRHTGAGISKEEIEKHNLPLEPIDHIPETIEEEIVALADKFFSKYPESLDREYTIEEIKEKLQKFGEEKVKRFEHWCHKYKLKQ